LPSRSPKDVLAHCGQIMVRSMAEHWMLTASAVLGVVLVLVGTSGHSILKPLDKMSFVLRKS
jgi:hypothetical protein